MAAEALTTCKDATIIYSALPRDARPRELDRASASSLACELQLLWSWRQTSIIFTGLTRLVNMAVQGTRGASDCWPPLSCALRPAWPGCTRRTARETAPDAGYVRQGGVRSDLLLAPERQCCRPSRSRRARHLVRADSCLLHHRVRAFQG